MSDINSLELGSKALYFANTEAGRHLLGIKEKLPIVKITSNSWHFYLGKQGEKHYFRGQFFCYKKVLKLLGPTLTKMQIAQESSYESFLHFSDLKRKIHKYPSIYLVTDNIVAGAGDGSSTHRDANWTTCRSAGAATYYTQYEDTTRNDGVAGGDVSGTTYEIGRSFFPFDTSGIGAGASIDSATLDIYGSENDDGDTIDIELIQTSQASTTEVVADDYDQVGSTIGATAIALSNWTGGSTETFTLNATGIGWIDTSGTTKLGLRSSTDLDDTTPSGRNRLDVSYSESANDPTLNVTYSVGNPQFMPLLGVGW